MVLKEYLLLLDQISLLMKRALAFLALLFGGLIIFGGVKIFGMPHESDIALFYIFRIGFIPIPIPVALLTSPHFWGGVICFLGLCLIVCGIGIGLSQLED